MWCLENYISASFGEGRFLGAMLVVGKVIGIPMYSLCDWLWFEENFWRCHFRPILRGTNHRSCGRMSNRYGHIIRHFPTSRNRRGFSLLWDVQRLVFFNPTSPRNADKRQENHKEVHQIIVCHSKGIRYNGQAFLGSKWFEESHQQNHRIDAKPKAEIAFNVQHCHHLQVGNGGWK